MSFLKELKEDLGQAMNELISDDAMDMAEEAVQAESVDTTKVADAEETEDAVVTDESEVNTLDFDFDAINEILEDEAEATVAEEITMNFDTESEMESSMMEDIMNEIDEDVEAETMVEEPADNNASSDIFALDDDDVVADEVTEITKGTIIEGNLSSNGSINVYGKVKGNVTCKGKLMIAGTIVGESSASEIFVNNAKVDGDVKSEGTIKIANGSVIIGNVYATSAVVAGAIKGDIDVHGPVIVDGTAVVKGDIKSRSVQINNGAAIEGFCSQCYADIDYKALFDETFSK